MVDTIVLLLTKDMYHISNPDKFAPNAQLVLATIQRSMQAKQNPTKGELAAGIYKPRLTLANRISFNSNLETILKIELSLPKLTFGNNFDELCQKDFPAVIQKLVVI